MSRTILIVGLLAALAVTRADGFAQTAGFADTYKRVKPSIVYVVAATAGGAQSGSGFVYDSDNTHSIIVTANHVVADARYIDVIFDSSASARYHATVLEHDRKRDVAFLDVPIANRLPLRLVERAQINEGNQIAVVGYPRAAKAFKDVVGDDLRPSVHAGIISAIRLGGELIQIDAQVDHGDSGGPVIDVKSGRVIGIVRGALLDSSYAARGIEQTLPGSAFAVSSTTIYAVRNGLSRDADAAAVAQGDTPKAAAAANGAAYRVAFASPAGTNAVVQSMMNLFTQRIREHFTGGNMFYAIPGSSIIYGQDSTKIADYCDSLRTSAIVIPYYQWRSDTQLAGSATVVVGIVVSDCYGVPFFTAREQKSESRMFANRSVEREIVDMGNDMVDRLLAKFDSFREAHNSEWQSLLTHGIAIDSSKPMPALVGVIAQDHQYRVLYLREEGRGAKAGLRVGDIIVAIDGTPVDRSATAFDVSQQIESARRIDVKRPDGNATIVLKP